jgi:cytosine/adenosine deaminase-related metal-dependent hydrolase
MPILTADYIYLPQGFAANHFLEVDEAGTIIDIGPITSEIPDLQKLSGVLVPGFVNTHCHLELSMMRGKIPRGTGMTGFIFSIVSERFKYNEQEQEEAARVAIREAWESGTVAIGDISNTTITMNPKTAFPRMYFHSFIELLGLRPEQAADVLKRGKELSKKFSALPHSITPHAPYSMSEELLEGIYQSSQDLLSIHLLESKEEREIFEQQKGSFLEFYAKIGVPFQGFPTRSAIEYVTTNMDTNQSVIMVHNTEMTQEEINQLVEKFPHLYFALCPRANQYIHGTSPDPYKFLKLMDRVCLGTDSLASNDSLNMLEEIKAIWRKNTWMTTHSLLKWATTNGAKAMRLSDKFGTFTPGKRPGVNLLKGLDLREIQLTEEAEVEKLY